MASRHRVPDGSATAKAIGHSVKRRGPLTHFIGDGDLALHQHVGQIGWRHFLLRGLRLLFDRNCFLIKR